jgi:hypothetical protein
MTMDSSSAHEPFARLFLLIQMRRPETWVCGLAAQEPAMPADRQPSFQTPSHTSGALILSFTRFVAAHGGSDSLRAAERPQQSLHIDPLTFTRHLSLVSHTPRRAAPNGESV